MKISVDKSVYMINNVLMLLNLLKRRGINESRYKR